ncbi:MAG TPA: winged helix-turn-helix domain-containing protein, partial [Candidatus Limnocylindrales bacterium]
MPKRPAQGIELLADPTRRRIMGLVALHPRRPSAIAAAIGLSRPATTRQIHLMRDAGLIRLIYSPHDSRARRCATNPAMIGPIAAWLAGVEVGRPFGLAVADDGST